MNVGFYGSASSYLKAVALLLLFTPSLGACITTYQAFPTVDFRAEPIPRKDVPIYYNVEPLAYLERAIRKRNPTWYRGGLDQPTRRTYEELERVFVEAKMFSDIIPTSSPPKEGIFCSVDVIYKPGSQAANFFEGVTLFTLFAIPSFSGTFGHIVKYDLYVNTELKKSYRYEITKTEGVWIGFLPFLWVNFLTPSEADAFRATTYQFFFDAEQDGYFDQS